MTVRRADDLGSNPGPVISLGGRRGNVPAHRAGNLVLNRGLGENCFSLNNQVRSADGQF